MAYIIAMITSPGYNRIIELIKPKKRINKIMTVKLVQPGINELTRKFAA